MIHHMDIIWTIYGQLQVLPTTKSTDGHHGWPDRWSLGTTQALPLVESATPRTAQKMDRRKNHWVTGSLDPSSITSLSKVRERIWNTKVIEDGSSDWKWIDKESLIIIDLKLLKTWTFSDRPHIRSGSPVGSATPPNGAAKRPTAPGFCLATALKKIQDRYRVPLKRYSTWSNINQHFTVSDVL